METPAKNNERQLSPEEVREARRILGLVNEAANVLQEATGEVVIPGIAPNPSKLRLDSAASALETASLEVRKLASKL